MNVSRISSLSSVVCAALKLAMLCTICLGPAARADDVITIRLVYHVIMNPANGSLPSGFSNDGLRDAVDGMNAMMESYGRGYRFKISQVLPLNPIGSVGGFDRPDPSRYFTPDMGSSDFAEELRASFEADANQFGGLYKYNTQVLNIFINNATSDYADTSTTGPILFLSGRSSSSSIITLHQIGHFFGLCHTQGCSCGCCSSGSSGECNTTPGSDGISDTLPDLPCWNRDDIALHSFGVAYAQVSAAQRALVDDVFGNIMSYHWSPTCSPFSPDVSRLTEKQLDRWADTASSTFRLNVCDGQTFFVQANFNGFQNGRSGNPFDLVSDGLREADGGGDIVMIRGGTYPERLRISTPVTLRTPRGQTARIGG